MTRKLAPQEKQARRPIQKACVFCHEKHLQCDLGRPCQNCLKRNISSTCRDKQRKPRRADRRRKKEGVSEPGRRKPSQTSRRLGIARLAMSSGNDTQIAGNPENQLIENNTEGNNTMVYNSLNTKELKNVPLDSMNLFANEQHMAMSSVNQDPNNAASLVSEDSVQSEADTNRKLSPIIANTPSLLKISPLGKISSLTNLLIPPNEQLFNSEGPTIAQKNDSQTDLTHEGVPEKGMLGNPKSSSNASFGSIWANNEYMKLNDILGSPVIPSGNSGPLQYSLPSEVKMDNYMSGFDSPRLMPGDVNNNFGLRSNSRPHISLDMATSSQLINGNLSDSVSPEVVEKDLSPLKFRQLVKTPEDLYEKDYHIKPHNYRAAYRDLSVYLKQRFLTSDRKSVKDDGARHLQNIAHSMTAHYSPIFVTLTTNLVEKDLELQELVLQRALLEYESMAKLTNCTPMCIWRRSGEICYVSNEFVSLTGFSRYEMLSQRRFIVEFLDDESVVDYFDIFHERLAFGSKEGLGATCDGQAVFSECNLLLKDGSFLKCACVWTVKRDSFNIPLLVMGQFLPIFDFSQK